MMQFFILALLPAIYAALALFGARFIPTHDGEYHIIRFWQFYKMVSQGYIFPRWAPDLNSGYGLPLFLFHYPFPNYIGSLFHAFGETFVDSVKLTLALGYLTSIVWCFLWLKSIFGNKASLIGTIICSMVPYWFVDIYVRGSVGEVWALSFVLLTLFSLERGLKGMTAIGIAGIILSHNITALIFIPILILYALYRKKGTVISFVIGVGLSTYFWLPALWEQRYMVGLNSVSYADHFPDLFQLLLPSWGTGFSGVGITANEMSYQIGIIPLVVFSISLIVAVRRKMLRNTIIPFLCVVLLAIFSMTEYSQPLWRFVPLMTDIQYPWRLLMVVIIATGYLAALLTTVLPRWIMVGLAVLAFMLSFSYMKPVTYERRDDAHYLSRIEFTDGTSSLGNSLSTIYTGWKKERFIKRFQTDSDQATITMNKESALLYEMTVNAQKESTVNAQILYFPGWTAYVDDNKTDIFYDPDGIIHVNIPKGEHRLTIKFIETPLRRFADGISLLSLFSLLSLVYLKILYAYRDKHITTFNRSQNARSGSVHKRINRRSQKK